MSDLEERLKRSERLRENIEYILQSAPKVKEVAEQLAHIEETGIGPIQKALDEIKLLKEGQTARHELLLELHHEAEQVRVRDLKYYADLKEILEILKNRLKESG